MSTEMCERSETKFAQRMNPDQIIGAQQNCL